MFCNDTGCKDKLGKIPTLMVPTKFLLHGHFCTGYYDVYIMNKQV